MFPAIRSGLSMMFILVAIASSGGLAMAGPLDPLAFGSLGTASLAAGPYTINTLAIGGPTLSAGGVVLFTGVISNGVAVFDFDSLTVARGAAVTATQGFGTSPLPVALLSRTTEDIAGIVDVSASGRQTGSGAAPLSNHGAGGTTGAYLSPSGVVISGISGGGGGGFGGAGGAGGLVTFPNASQVFGGAGEAAFANLATTLQGGGLGAPGGFGSISLSGGGGGGAIELGALLGVTISGEVDAFGGNAVTPGAGGGAGGGIFIHAPTVALTGLLDVQGGAGAPGTIFSDYSYYAGGGGGGGGKVLIQAGAGGYSLSGGQILLHGGAGGSGLTSGLPDDGSGGANGSLIVAGAVPEPSSLVLISVPIAFTLAFSWIRRISPA